MSHKLLIAGALLSVAVAPSTLSAQSATDTDRSVMPALAPAAVTRTAAPCSFADCALRVERGFWSGPTLVRGATGQPVADLGALRPPASLALFAANDSASHYATQYLQAARVNRPLTIVGIALAAVGLAQDQRTNGYTIVGASMIVVSIPFQVIEERALSRAVWWYNSTLPTAADPR